MPKALEYHESVGNIGDEGVVRAYASGGYSMKEAPCVRLVVTP